MLDTESHIESLNSASDFLYRIRGSAFECAFCARHFGMVRVRLPARQFQMCNRTPNFDVLGAAVNFIYIHMKWHGFRWQLLPHTANIPFRCFAALSENFMDAVSAGRQAPVPKMRSKNRDFPINFVINEHEICLANVNLREKVVERKRQAAKNDAVTMDRRIK